jgi:CRISPR-associated exonuclease Cas4
MSAGAEQQAGDGTHAASAAADPVPISALQHAVYCLRQAALIHLERLWEDNRFTAEGHVLHAVADKAGSRRVRGIRRVMALPIASRRFNLAGVADMVEFLAHDDGETPFPVEYKRGKPKQHQADEVQLCAQALCLEEMTGRPVPEGALFYAETKRRVVVAFDAELRRLTEATAGGLAEIFQGERTPPPTQLKQRCRACSLKELCRPGVVTKSASAWRRRMLASLVTDVPYRGAR